MSENTYSVLATLFSLILITGVLERRSPIVQIRRAPFYRRMSIATFGAAILGTFFSVVGVSNGGTEDAFLSAFMWILFVGALGLLGIILIASLVSAELEEDEAAD